MSELVYEIFCYFLLIFWIAGMILAAWVRPGMSPRGRFYFPGLKKKRESLLSQSVLLKRRNGHGEIPESEYEKIRHNS
jgi:hypothetical protein